MLYLKSKIISLTILLVLLFASCSNIETPVEKKDALVSDSTILSANETFTILLSGPPPPIMYSNALDIIGKRYRIDFVYAAGCIVSERLDDSISTFNDESLYKLNKYYHKDLSLGLFDQLDKENSFLNRVDSSIRNKESIKKTYDVADKSIYYTKKNKSYLAHFISSNTEGKIMTFRLNLIMTIDSATKNITKTVLKDSLIDYNFRNLSAND
ncbi:MAG: hypothetical protein H0U95_11555 [Bacteroidetes bacterium]|nr:hypothetical protein [Bacteroidota bacterium]